MANEERRKRRRIDAQTDRQNDLQNDSAAREGVPRESIELRAYERYMERGGAHGGDLDDWLEAERELNARGADANG